jgi:Uncharacterized low-complexity proteins
MVNLSPEAPVSKEDIRQGLRLKNVEFPDGVDLTNADLSRSQLINVDLTGANLSDADLSRADLTDTTFDEANLSHADLSYVDFTNATFVDADLSSVDFSYAELNGADFSNADFTNATSREVLFDGADFTGADLTGTELDLPYLHRDAEVPIVSDTTVPNGTTGNSFADLFEEGTYSNFDQDRNRSTD